MKDVSGVDRGRCPVAFDHDSKSHALEWPAIYQELRQECPVAWTESHGGFWVASRYKDVVALAQADAVFKSAKQFDPATGEVSGGIGIPPAPTPGTIPDETDRPDWEAYRQLLNRHFGPKGVERYRQDAGDYATWLIDRVIETGKIDLVNDFASPLPAMVTMTLSGFPLGEAERFADLIHKMIYTPSDDPGFGLIVAELGWIQMRVAECAAQYRDRPADNFLSYIVHTQINGRGLTDDEIQRIMWNVLLGGVDTTTALTANVLLYLCQHPDARQHLIEHPESLPVAREEFVRFFSPIHATARTAHEDARVGDETVRAGERILLAYASANRDPEVFDDPETIILNRYPNRHVGFGAGMHRCAGSFLARMMFETMVNEVLRRIPDYQVDVERARRYTSIYAVNGWIDMPATFTPGAKSGRNFGY